MGPRQADDAATIADRRLTATAIVAAVVVAGFGALRGSGLVMVPWLGEPAVLAAPVILAVAVGVMALSQLGRLRVRARDGALYVAWGDAAVVIQCYLLPAVWVPVTTLAGFLLAYGLRALFVPGRSRIWSNAATLTLAAAAAATVAHRLGVTPGAPLTLALALALAATAPAYLLTSGALVAAHVSIRSGASFGRVLRDALSGSLLMSVGNVAVSLVVVAVLQVDGRWLLLFPPVLWLLHQTYAYRLRGDDERRTWQRFAEATRQLNRLDERHAAAAGLRGAQRLFDGAPVELIVTGPVGAPRGYALTGDGILTEAPPVPVEAGDPVVCRALLVGGQPVGELRLHLARPGALSARDRLMLAAYGDALAGALHDAVTNTELRELSDRNTHDAVHDPLTGLANRASLVLRGTALLRANPPQTPVGLLLLDLNDFKDVNTTLGHGAGDELLRVVAERLAGVIGAGPAGGGPILARLGGDEFAVLLVGGPAVADVAVAQARHLAGLLAVPTEVAGVQLSVETSIGVVSATAGSVDMTELLRRGDIAMYQAKRAGSSVAVYESTRDEASTDRLALLAELREALAVGDQLYLLLQPAIALDTGRPVGVEALVRWQHPRRGRLEPADFVGVVEQSELIGAFTRHVVDLALAEVVRFAAADLALPVSVNLSARSLLDPDLPGDIGHLLMCHDVPARRLVLEITETVVMSELPVVDEVLAGLRALGVQLAVDDFGTGYSSLTFLTRVAVDEVKVDRSFIGRMVDSPEAAAIVRTTVELGRELGLRVVAEGVETAEQRRALVALGCPAAQGFHFYRPMPGGTLLSSMKAFREGKLRLTRQDRRGA